MGITTELTVVIFGESPVFAPVDEAPAVSETGPLEVEVDDELWVSSAWPTVTPIRTPVTVIATAHAPARIRIAPPFPLQLL